MKKKLRPLGDITQDMEKLLEEMTDEDNHGLQHGEVLALVYTWLCVHAPQAKEEYLDGTHPIYYYGPKND